MRTLMFVLALSAAAACSRTESAAPPADNANAAAPTTGAAPPTPAAAPATSADKPAATDTSAAAAPTAEPAVAEEKKPQYREVTIPSGTTLPLTLQTAVGSDTSKVEDQVRATLRSPIAIKGIQALPEGTAFIGHVTDAERSGRVKGRASIAFRFTRADPPGEREQLTVRTATVSRLAPATKKRDAATIGGGAVGGAVIGGIVGGGSGAAKGAAIGGAGGTGVVLATRGKEVKLAAGTSVNVKLAAPLTVKVPIR